jgi:HNH endonuclease
MPRVKPDHRALFWAKVDKSGECWIWTGCKMPKGYGKLKFEGRYDLAHRVSWVIANGPVTPGLIVCHRCDVPSCVNPAHLFLGTYSDNTQDMLAKHRDATRQPEFAAASAKRTADALALAAERGYPHGTLTGYNNRWRCRDICCKEAKAQWLRDRTAARRARSAV